MSYAIYIDESYDKKSKYTIMVGFIVSFEKWKSLHNEIEQLKLKYFSDSSINLKAIRRKNYDENKYWELLPKEKKEEFNKEFYGIICKKDYTIIAGVINKERMDDTNKELLFYLCYGFIIQRYQYFLSHNRSYGIVIMDIAEASKEVRDLYYTHKKFMREGVPVKREDMKLKIGEEEISIKDYKKQALKNICENLIFLNDKDNSQLQITDMIAAAMFSKFNRSSDVWYLKVEKIFRCSDDGKIDGYGIKFFPEA
ncbi:DUF3800 domain-containing protein [Candidatus Woesearchaeota archaeon]|nr:DUF3800 domain-containing protein [Candidatus Woesearchaeota archaeon]